MDRGKVLAGAAAALLAGSLAASAQVTATQPTSDQARAMQGKPPAPEEMCPLQLDIDLSKTPTHHALNELAIGKPWAAKGVRGFVCDKARFMSMFVVQQKKKRDKVLLVVSPRLATDWFRQDVNLTVQVLVNGEVKLTKQWEDLTIGTEEGAAAAWGVWGSSSSKSPRAEWWVPTADLQSWFAEGSKPSVRMLLVISDSEEEDGEEDEEED
jgi:hypothetical protein